ncbi:MAG: FAD-dependent oxidoreductase, partial [Pseudomonadota bacterium]
MTPSTTRLLLLIAATLLIGTFFYFDLGQYLSLEALRNQRDQLLGFTEQHFWPMLFGYMAVYILMAALSLPGAAILTLAGGALFGLVTGTIAVSFASSIGATLVFLAARWLFRDSIQSKFGSRLETINQGVERDGAFYLLALRLVPAFPFWLINLLMALTRLRPWTFYWVSQLGMLPATIVFVNAGTQLGQIESTGDILSPALIGAFALLGLLPIVLRFLLRWIQARKVYSGYVKPKTFDYNLIAIGAGSAGLVTAYIGAAVQAKVALIEKHQMGGDCLNTGCVPSKALIRTARLVHEAKSSERFGIAKMTTEFNFKDVLNRVRNVISKIEPHDSPERYRGLGVDVIEGSAQLVSPWAVEVNGNTITARSIVLATGAAPLVPPIEGLDQIDYLTSDSIWDLDDLPKRLVVLGGGPIGAELTQAFTRLGAQVTVVEMAERLLPREDADAAAAVQDQFERDGVRIATATRAVRFESDQHGQRLIGERLGDTEGETVTIEFDHVLIALGR